MIEIKKTTDTNVYREFDIDVNEKITVMAAKEKDEVFGVGVARFENGYAVIEKIEMKDGFKMFDLDFGMGKSVLNMIDLEGIRYVFSNLNDDRLMTALRFKKNSDLPDDVKPDKEYKYFLCLDGYFTLHKCDGE